MAVTELQPTIDETRGRPLEWLEAEITTLAGHIAAATCRWLILVAEFDRREGWKTWECLSCAHWLSWKCGMSVRTAQEHVRVGLALGELPVTTAEYASGQLSYSKVRAITRVATPKSEPDLVVVAKRGTATHVERIVAGFCMVKRNMDPERGRTQMRRRGVWQETADDGTVTITVRATPDAAAAIVHAIDAAAVLPELVDEPDARRAAKRCDGLEHVARAYLEPDEHKAPNTELVVHADLETLAEREPGRSDIENGPSLSAATLERLACDCGLRLAVDEHGKTLDIGRRSRTIPPALRRAIVDRDQGQCRFPGCTHKGRLQVHHGQHCAPCPHRHRMLDSALGEMHGREQALTGAARMRHRIGLVAAVAMVAGAAVMVPAPDARWAGARSTGLDIEAVARRTRAAGTARFAAAAVPVGRASRTDEVEGEFDFVAGRASYLVREDSGARTRTVRGFAIDGYLYVEHDASSADVTEPPGLPWLRQRVPGTDEPRIDDFLEAPQMLHALERSRGTSKRIGRERVRGVPTVHYRFTVRGRLAPAQVVAMGSSRRRIRTIELWVDAEQRIRRLRQKAEMRPRSISQIELFDFGAPISIKAPPADQVATDDPYVVTGGWSAVMRGRSGSTRWQVHQASTAIGTCYAHTTYPPAPPVPVTHEQAGRPSDLCVWDRDRPGAADYEHADLSTTAITLPNGTALLYGRVVPAEQTLTLRFGDGHTRRVRPEYGTFAVVLDADELVASVTTNIEGRKTRCPLRRGDFDCTGSRVAILARNPV